MAIESEGSSIENLVDEMMSEAEAGAAAEVGGTPPAEAAAPETTPEPTKQEAQQPPEGKADEVATAPESQPAGVLAADGKTIIPYGALSAARQSAQQERAARIALEQEVERLKAERTNPLSAEDPDADAKLAALREKVKTDFSAIPEMAEVFEPLLDTVAALQRDNAAFRKQAEALAQREQDDVARQQQDRQTAIQQAIDANPTLLYWQTSDPSRWNFAAEQDRLLRESPAGASLSLEARFAKVVSATEALLGPTDLPAEYRPKQGAAPLESQGDVQKRAEARLQQADKDAAKRPVSLSDIPGGVPPLSDDKNLESMSMQEIESRVDSMLAKGMSIQDIVAMS